MRLLRECLATHKRRCSDSPSMFLFQHVFTHPTKSTSNASHRGRSSLAAWVSGRRWLGDARTAKSFPPRPRYPSSMLVGSGSIPSSCETSPALSDHASADAVRQPSLNRVMGCRSAHAVSTAGAPPIPDEVIAPQRLSPLGHFLP